nr:unnamed protein product [Callosobruchus analis]
MAPSGSRYSGGKIPGRSDLRVPGGPGGTLSEVISINRAATPCQANNSSRPSQQLCIDAKPEGQRNLRRFGVCVYVKAGISCHREEELEPESFDVIWLKISFKNNYKFICCIYRPPSSKNYKELFEKLSATVDMLQSDHPNSEIVFLGVFNVHNSYWLKHSNKTDDEGREAEAFAISCGLEQIVKEPTRIPSCHGDFASLLDLYLTTTPTFYTVKVSPPLGLSDHNSISALCRLQCSDLQHTNARRVWHYRSTKWDYLRDYYQSFPWNDVCFKSRNPSACAQEITEVLISGMEAYIPPVVKRPSKNKPWFNQSCEDKSIASTPKEKADTLGKLFAANSTVDYQGSPPTTTFNVSSRVTEVKFQQRDVKKILQNHNTNKVSGSDQIPAIAVKCFAVELTPILCKLFKISPVALFSIMSKVMETVINTQLLEYLENNNIIRDRQYGFRKHRSTGDLLAYVTHMWNRAIENHGESRVVALDISKAFDRVWHERLLAKLAAYGLPSSLRQWLNSFLNARSLSVVVEDCSSDVFPINAGVPQGSVLSPTLLRLYINELLEITSNPVYSFADDSTLVSYMEPGKPLPSQETARLRHHHASQINADIKKVVEWGLVNKVQFNVQKTQTTTLTRKSLVGLPTVEMEGRPLVESPSVKLTQWGTTPTVDLIRLVKDVVRHVRQTDLYIVATVSDQGATNVAAIRSLLNGTNAHCLSNNVDNRFQGY